MILNHFLYVLTLLFNGGVMRCWLCRIFCKEELKLPPILESRALLSKAMHLVFLYRRMSHYTPSDEEMQWFAQFEQELREAYYSTQAVERTLVERRGEKDEKC